jgi:hypothetical protein
MNAVEIEYAISRLAESPFDRFEFPYLFLEAFGNKPPTLKKLRDGDSNKSDILGGVLQRLNIHILPCDVGSVTASLKAMKGSVETVKAKVKFILATDGIEFQAEDMVSGETVACDYVDFADHFGFFLPLAGISTVREIRDNPIDIKATSRLNRLYVELLSHNPDWDTALRSHDMNQFMARLIFCFFAEDTDIFNGDDLFTATIEQMSESDASNLDHVIGEIFRAMDTKVAERPAANLPSWADAFPYVNGKLFCGVQSVPKFTRIGRSYLIHAGGLNWKQINPDIFGSMIQAVADKNERSQLGMHYTSVPNILKVLNPLFLDELREQLIEAKDSGRKLLNLRKRMARIRVFDPACGSGNFLVIAYKEMRAIEAEINKRRRESELKSEIPLNNFRGIEINNFPAEIARLALIIAEFQCDIIHRGQKEALQEFLPLDSKNWIVCGNALRLDWLSICPPTGTTVKYVAEDLLHTPLDQPEIDFDNEGGETFICGNPPYLGSTWQTKEQKSDLKAIFGHRTKKWKSLDYVCGWFMKAVDYGKHTQAASAFVSTNSICQGQQVPILWPPIFATGHEIVFAHTSFKWTNLASHSAGVTVAIVGISKDHQRPKFLYALDAKPSEDATSSELKQTVNNINGYLLPAQNITINPEKIPISQLSQMTRGNGPVAGGGLHLSREQLSSIGDLHDDTIIRLCLGSEEFIHGKLKYCFWFHGKEIEQFTYNDFIRDRLKIVTEARLASKKGATKRTSDTPHLFAERRQEGTERVIAIPSISSENREYLPVGVLERGNIITNKMFGIFDAPLWNMALIASKLHRVWIETVCGKLETRFCYSNTLGWNTFPVPPLTEQNKEALTRCAEDILLAREVHFPATIADLYDPEKMPDNLREAHNHNDEVLERIYIGRLFKNNTERLEILFDLYAKMVLS